MRNEELDLIVNAMRFGDVIHEAREWLPRLLPRFSEEGEKDGEPGDGNKGDGGNGERKDVGGQNEGNDDTRGACVPRIQVVVSKIKGPLPRRWSRYPKSWQDRFTARLTGSPMHLLFFR